MTQIIPPAAGAVDLRQSRQIVITDMRILIPASVNFMLGGCNQLACTHRLEVVDMRTGVMYLVPFPEPFARQLHTQLGALLDAPSDTERKVVI